MDKMFYCWLSFFCQLWSLQALSLESLVSQSSIYYQMDASELLLQHVDQLTSVDSLKLIVHGFVGSRSHGSIMPLINGKIFLGLLDTLEHL